MATAPPPPPNRRRWRPRLAVLGLALALVAGACGGGDDGDAASSTSPGGGAVDLTGVTLDVSAVWSGEEQASFEAVLAAFEERTGATVRYTSTGDDIAAVLGPAIDAGSPPDVAMLPQPGLLRDLAAAGSLVAVEDVVGALVDEDYAPVWRELATVDGTLYGVWFKAANKSTVWYDPAALETAGVTPPETWEDFQAAAQAIADSGTVPLSVAGADGWTLTDWFENVYLRTAGTDRYDALSAHEIPWTDESVVGALTTLAELLGNPDFVAGGPQGALQVEFPESVAQVFGDAASAAIVFEGDFVAGVIESDTPATLGTGADFFAFPSVGGSGPAVVGAGDVAVLLRDSPGGRALLEFLASPEAAEVWAGRGGFASPNQAVDASVYPDDITRRSAQALTSAETFRFDMSDLQPAAFGATVGSGEWKILQDWLADPSDPGATAAALESARQAAG